MSSPQNKPSTALRELQKWLNDGSLARMVKEHKLGAELGEVRAVLRTGKKDLERVKALGQAARIVSDVPWESVRNSVDRLQKIGDALESAQTPEQLYDWRRVQWTLLSDATSTLDRILRTAWQLKCEQPFAEHERLGAVLNLLPNMKDLGEKMVRTAGVGRNLGQRFPPEDQDKLSFKQSVDRAAKERDELRGQGGNEAISQLLLAAADQRATLADLSPEALEWLRRNKALKL